MPQYLLPCKCGEQVVVSTAQAGETVRCTCGAELHVPTMRGLQDMEPIERATTRAGRTGGWDDQHRVAFLLILGALTCVAVAIYLWFSMPVPAVQPEAAEYQTVIESTPPAELFLLHTDAAAGRLGNPLSTEPERKTRQMMQWGIGIVLALGAAALACAAIVLINRPRPVSSDAQKTTAASRQ